MKIVFKVLGVLTVVVALLICSLGAVRNLADAEDVEAFETEMAESRAQIETLKQESGLMDGDAKASMDESIRAAEDAMGSIPPKSAFTTAGILLAVLALLSIVCGVFLFVHNPKIGMGLSVLMIILAIVAVIVSPSLEGGLTSGASNRAIAIAAGVPVALSAIFLFLLSRQKA